MTTPALRRLAVCVLAAAQAATALVGPLPVAIGLAPLLFAALSRHAAASGVARVAAIVHAVALSAAAVLATLGALLMAWLRCDESCAPGVASSWTENPDAWQWTAQLVPAALGLTAMLAGLVQTVRRRHRSALAWTAAAAACFEVWAVMGALG